MRIINVFTLPLLANAVSVAHLVNHERRQLSGMLAGLTSFMGSPLKPVLQKKATAEFNPSASRESLVWGPFKLKAANSSHAGGVGIKLDPNSDTLSGLLSNICQECIVHRAKVEVSDKDGNRLDVDQGIYTHHFITMDIGRTQIPNAVGMGCGRAAPPPGGLPMGAPKSGAPGLPAGLIPAASIFIGKGEEETSVAFSAPGSDAKVKSGYYIAKTDKIMLTAEIVNYYKQDREVYVHMDYEFTPNVPENPKDVMKVGMGAISVDCAMVKALDPPRDKAITYKSPGWKVTYNGYLMNITPHLHDGAVNIKVFRNGEPVCTSNAVYGSAVNTGEKQEGGKKYETITSYTPCQDPVKIKKGDELTMTSDYDLTKYNLRPSSHAGHGSDQSGASGGKGSSMMTNGEGEALALATFIWAMAPDQTDKWTG